MSRTSRIVISAVGAMMAVLVVLAIGIRLVPAVNVGGGRPVLAAAPTAAEPASAGAFSTAVHQVAEQVKPAVVQITNERQVDTGRLAQPYTVPAGVGSGVIYDDQGHILTNNHVVDGASSLLVSLPDGRSFEAAVVGRDPRTDLAVLKVDGRDLPVAQLGDSDQLQVGDWVVAIGNALALPGGPTVTAGVVSALNRTVQEPGDNADAAGPFLFDVIQTDAPINPGNSGGPLVDLGGRVVGINTLAAGQAEPGVQAEGIGFAISMAAARPIADQLVATGTVVHPFLGVQYAPLNPAIVARLSLSVKDGALITAVASGSPAARAGLRAREVVTRIDGSAIADDSDLARAIEVHKPGERVTLAVVRGGQTQQIQVTLGQVPGA